MKALLEFNFKFNKVFRRPASLAGETNCNAHGNVFSGPSASGKKNPTDPGFSKKPGIRMISSNVTSLLWGVLFSTIGWGYFIHGRRQANLAFIASGIELMLYPFFISNSFAVVFVGITLVFIPGFIEF